MANDPPYTQYSHETDHYRAQILHYHKMNIIQ